MCASGDTRWCLRGFVVSRKPLYGMVTEVSVSFLCIFIVTKLTTPPPETVTELFDGYKKEVEDGKT